MPYVPIPLIEMSPSSSSEILELDESALKMKAQKETRILFPPGEDPEYLQLVRSLIHLRLCKCKHMS